jgi:hypothetical protein
MQLLINNFSNAPEKDHVEFSTPPEIGDIDIIKKERKIFLNKFTIP